MNQLEELVEDINRFEAIIAEWDESQRCVAVGLKRSIEALHKAALTNLIKSLKQNNMSGLRDAVSDEIVYAVLLYHELVKPPLAERIQTALAEVRPGLQSHNGDIELVAIKPPDTVEVKLIGSCSSCPSSTLTLTQGVEEAIKKHCPEITKVIAVNSSPNVTETNFNSPFPLPTDFYWVRVATVDQINKSSVLSVRIANQDLILNRQGENITCYRNSCSHLGYPLDKGKVEKGIITCSAHEFQYDLKTGKCLTTPDISLHSYPVKIKGDKVYIKVPNSNQK
ncbi:NifU family protein [Anabaena cylindrica FACHB-243]|uniref:Nitrogen-fixing NifU domain-containing protein n=1 Tax=Anabaena cylindrica (strain ATCC 27899 / PCC 7122) TaxID=272123 RepID=K9ZDK3_ANACC|nr:MULTISPECIES: NifU family protein [Anabaena]AFZ57288.1 nitrogen-fixing NifU domain-containing protein [Anabaena cylindrica PCC 7122]AZL96697.1 nitrogen-fixing NifU domain-containing protein [Anabaena sp. CCAP 1446/1C]MBD2420957.1 NifU family protein [Anabaena cylindrica FACHB-243]MBY5283442.1 Rieske 2Fe-2S domain-containing protein [Anabaena sp. CCAP 1446/1C]MBY5310888.1 Rieske 2Fe-2S domain-containing protein [Anabaena sp. CCAP 1446/1C]